MTFDFGDLRDVTGPLDLIGDVHGCFDELIELLGRLGYRLEASDDALGPRTIAFHPEGRRAVFVGDLVDRGPKVAAVLRLVMAMVEAGHAYCVPGNHDLKFMRWLAGHKVMLTHGLDVTVQQIALESEALRAPFKTFIERLPTYLWLDGGKLVVSHAGIAASMIGQIDGRIRHFCVYGDTDGKSDAQGVVIRYNWATTYDGPATVVYGHIPVVAPAWVNNTVCIDTGCCFGGTLTALRWPERDVVSVAALKAYWPRARDFGLPAPRP